MSRESAAPQAPAAQAQGTGRNALSIRGLSRQFGGLMALSDLSFDVEEDAIFGVVGPNGAGKTTLINLISGLDRATSGRIELFGDRIDGLPAHQVARRGIARTYQNIRLFPGLSVVDTVIAGRDQLRRSTVWGAMACLPRERRERKRAVEDARALLARVGVTAPPEAIATRLSYGEQRRVELARALAFEPKVLLLDEPTAGMNHAESSALGSLLEELRAERLTLVLVEHNIKLVLDFCSSAAVIDFGTLLIAGQPRECMDDPAVQEAYFGKSSHA